MAEFIALHGHEIASAAQRIAGHVRRTPLLSTDLHPGLMIKPENLQVTGAFKARGAFNALLALKERQPDVRGVCTVSSGNHAGAVAFAARESGLQATIVIPEGANPIKVSATREYGAEVIMEGVTFENREDVVARVAVERGLHLVHPFDDWDVIHGQGTVGREILEIAPSAGAIVAPIGGGGLLSGLALAARHAGSRTKVFGAEPAVADDAARSFEQGRHLALERTPPTIADGVKVLSIGETGYDVIVSRRLVEGIVRVTETQLEEATRLAWAKLRLAIEPTSALPLAAWLNGLVPRGTAESPTVLVLTGGNFDPAVLTRILSS